ncbi:hypothetical protein NP493_876g00003 [Ridgeia piscesae]|uniref:C3H1-type domain-containing protein n=1 Tax=Ridgeia piscesae TaxID=27915 RepID=A0AAD9KLE3_RIDPI|nr:hypothetical protein NP493_876g00003 [Ridgeia piscesae]
MGKGKQYFCEYCEKSFADNPTSRRNHLRGLQHQRMKNLHYESVQDAATILAVESSKNACHMFQQSGHCKFGITCKYSHMTRQQRNELEKQVGAETEARRQRQLKNQREPSLDEWLAKRAKKSPSDDRSVTDETSQRSMYCLPSWLEGITNLPPSVLPPPPEAFQDLQPLEWG